MTSRHWLEGLWHRLWWWLIRKIKLVIPTAPSWISQHNGQNNLIWGMQVHRCMHVCVRERETEGDYNASISSVQFSRSVVSDSLRPHESEHARPPCHHQLPEFTQTHVHRVSDAIQPSHPLSSPFPPAPNSPSIRVFPMSQLFAWGGQSTGASALASFPPKNTQGWSRSEWTGWISLQSKGFSEYKYILY